MKNGFELLKTNSMQGAAFVSRLEQEFKFKLPPIFKMFASHFELGQFYTEKYFVPKYNDYYYIVGNEYESNKDVDCTGFFQIDKIFENKSTLQGYGDEDIEKELIRIAEIGLGGSIFVGTKEDEIDTIILSVWDREPQYKILAKNIFDFMQGMKSIPVPEEELIDAKYSQLYKNFGEDFWRVREENI